jgi:hypothetical protein
VEEITDLENHGLVAEILHQREVPLVSGRIAGPPFAANDPLDAAAGAVRRQLSSCRHPREVVSNLNAEIDRIVPTPDVKARLRGDGFQQTHGPAPPLDAVEGEAG